MAISTPRHFITAGVIFRTALLCFLSFFIFSKTFAASSSEDNQITISHAYALHGAPKYPENFKALDYVNPTAPKGGNIRLMATGSFDTLNPYTLKGISPVNTPGTFKYGIGEHNESLLKGTSQPGLSGDEPQTAYGLIAQKIEYPRNLNWVIFHLRPEARFHDGSQITASDVAFSFATLIKSGHPRFQNQLKSVEKAEVLSPLSIKFTLTGDDKKTLPLRIGEMPVMSKAFWSNKDFAKGLTQPPLLSGPYKISKYEFGKYIEFERVENYWGKDLAINKGRHNFDKVRFDFYRDLTIAFEAFKSKEFDVYLEYISKNWATGYDFPALQKGEIIKEEIPHQTLAGSQGFFFNTRRELFRDIRVREALSLLFDFEWTNKQLFYGAYERSNSYFANTELEQTGIPQGLELEYLETTRDHQPETLFTKPFNTSKTDGSGQIRKQIRQALSLLKKAGWQRKDGQLTSASGKPFEFEILIRQPSISRVLNPFVQNLSKLGITANLRVVDPSQYKQRMDEFDFDMTTYVLSQSLSPGHEQAFYFASHNADVNGSLNISGVKNKAVDQLINKITAAESREQLVAATKALDRTLLWQHYMIPNWHIASHRIAYRSFFGRPTNQAPLDLAFDTWWKNP